MPFAATVQSLQERIPFDHNAVTRRGRLTAERLCRDRRPMIEFEDVILARAVVAFLALEGVYDANDLCRYCADHPDRWQALQKGAVWLAAGRIHDFINGLQIALRCSAEVALITYANLTENLEPQMIDTVLGGWDAGLIEGATLGRM